MISILNSRAERLFFVENIADNFSFIHSLNFSDLVILLIDAFFGVELETFETITLVKNSNLKRYIFILTHLDLFKTWKSLRKAKKRIKDRLNKETNGNCKIFYFGGIKENNIYFFGEIKNLTRYLNRVKLSYSFPLMKIPNHAIITKIDFRNNIRKNTGFFTGYFKHNFSQKKIEDCYIPGVGKILILKIKKSSIESEKKTFQFLKKRNNIELSFIDYTNPIFRKKIDHNRLNRLQNLLFFSFSLNTKQKRIKENSTILLIDSYKIFDPFINFEKKTTIELLISIFEKIYFKKIKKNKFKKTESLNLFSKHLQVSKENNKQASLKSERYRFEFEGFPSDFKKNYDIHFLLTIVFGNTDKRKKIVAKIFKNKWENELLFSGKYYILSIGFKLIITRLYFCNQKKNNSFNIINKIKAINFYYICFDIAMTTKEDLVIGLEKKSQIRNTRNQGASFSFLFFGKILQIKTSFKMFKKLKLKGNLIKKYDKTAFVTGMFRSNMEAIKYEGACIKTFNGIKGIIKSIYSSDSKGIFRATFEKNIKNENFVFIRTFIEVKSSRNSKEIFFQLVPCDYRELL